MGFLLPSGAMPVNRRFLGGAVLLSAAGLLSRVFGLYRLALPSLIGPVGVGLYHMAYPVYALALAVSTGGLPVAISKLVAERVARAEHGEARRIVLVSLGVLAPLGAAMAAALYLGAPDIAREVARDPKAALSIRAIAPAVFLVAVMSVLRGYHQGYQDMVPTAVSQLVEQAVRVGVLVILVVLLAPRGVAAQAAGAASGAVAGALAGILALFVLGGRRREASGKPFPATARTRPFALVREIVALALPVTVAGLAIPLMQLGDLVMVPARLAQVGVATAQRTALYGELSGYATPIANLPSVVTFAIAVALVPAVAEAVAGGRMADARRRIEAALRVAGMVAMPAALGLVILGPALMTSLFASPEAGRLLTILGPSIFFLGLVQVTTGALQGLDRASWPVRNIFLGVALKFALTWWLLPPFGVAGAAMATASGYLCAALLNLIDLKRVLGRLPSLVNVAVRPATGLPFLAVFALLGVHLGGGYGAGAALTGVGAGAVGYLLGLLLLGGISDGDMRALPGGAVLIRALTGLGLWRG